MPVPGSAIAAWLIEFIFFSWYQFIDRSFTGMVNSVSDWQSFPGCKDSRQPAYDVQDGVSALLQSYTCKLVCVSMAAKLLLHIMKSETSRVSFLWLNVLPAQTENTLPRLDEIRIAIQLHFWVRSCRMYSGSEIQHSPWLNMWYTQPICILPWQACHLVLVIIHLQKVLTTLGFFCCLWLYCIFHLEEKTYCQLLLGCSKSTLKLWRL